MKSIMLNQPNSGFGSSATESFSTVPSTAPKKAVPWILKAVPAALLCASLVLGTPSVAAVTQSLKPQPQADASKAVQAQVDKQTGDAAADKRRKLLVDATEAVAETQLALKALDAKKSEEALKALADATGRLELIVARDPALKLAPVATSIETFDVFASPETVKATIGSARQALGDDDVQRARTLMDALVSEVQIRTTNIPLATYPAAIKAITPLIDAGKIDEARTQLETALSTLVVTTDVIPLPKLRAEDLLKDAQAIAERKDRKQEDNQKLSADLKAAREQLQMAELLGYGKKADYRPMYDQLDKIETESAGGRSGTGWFDKIKKQVEDIF